MNQTQLIPCHPMNQTLELKTDHKKGTAQITNCGIGSEKIEQVTS
jgi:hypothetical protein